jgi:hypothetical protein
VRQEHQELPVRQEPVVPVEQQVQAGLLVAVDRRAAAAALAVAGRPGCPMNLSPRSLPPGPRTGPRLPDAHTLSFGCGARVVPGEGARPVMALAVVAVVLMLRCCSCTAL